MVLTPTQADTLREISNIGAGHAANALASLLQTSIMIGEPDMSLLRSAHLQLNGQGTRAVIATSMRILGDAPCELIVAFKRESAIDLATEFVRRMIGIEQPSHDDIRSTIQEFGNILAGSYVMALSTLTELKLSLSEPTVLEGAIFDILDPLLQAHPDRDAVVIDSKLLCEGQAIDGQVILIPEEATFLKLITPLEAQARGYRHPSSSSFRSRRVRAF